MNIPLEVTPEQTVATICELIPTYSSALADIVFVECTRGVQPSVGLRNIAETFRDHLTRHCNPQLEQIDLSLYISAFRQICPYCEDMDGFLIAVVGETPTDQ